jgi:hypothetical protein
MASEYDTLLVAAPPPTSEYDALLDYAPRDNLFSPSIEPERKKPDVLDLFNYHVADNTNKALQGVFRWMGSLIEPDMSQDQDIPPTPEETQKLHESRNIFNSIADKLEKYRADALRPYYGVTDDDLKTTTSKVTGAAAQVGDIAFGAKTMIAKLAGETYGRMYDATAQRLQQEGVTNPEQIQKQANAEASDGVIEMAPVLMAYAAGGKIAAKGAEMILPESAGRLARFAIGSGTSAGANLAVSGTTRAIQGEPFAGDLQQNLTDIFFGAAGGLHEAIRPREAKSVETSSVDPEAIAAANEAASQAIALEEGTASTAEPVESLGQTAETQTGPVGAAVAQVPSDEIASRPDLMQFKRMDDVETGENAADRITATYDPLKAGNLLLWEPNDPRAYGLAEGERYIVANGHHRNAAAIEQGVEAQNAQILREAEGFSAGDARAIAAESNIADGKGTIYDQAKFIRNEATTHGADAALERAGQIGARGRKAATIAIASEPDLFASFINEQVTPEQTAAIASSAPNNGGLQRLGIRRALDGDPPEQIANFLEAVKTQTGAQPTSKQAELFARDDAALNTAEAAAGRAGAIQREISDQINAVAGAARRPEKAAALGVDVRDPQQVQARLAELQMLRERARNWSADAEIRDITLRGYQSPVDAVKQLQSQTLQSPRLRSGEKNTGELFQRSDQPFNLAGETGIDFAQRGASVEAEQRAAASALAAHDQQQTKLFASGSATPHKSPPPPGVQRQLPAPQPSNIGKTITPLRTWWKSRTIGIRKLVAPQTIDETARTVANIIRDYNGQAANHLAQAETALAEWRASFDQTPVARDWRYDPSKPLPRNYAFMAESEKGGVGLTPNESTLKRQLDSMFAEAVAEVHRVKPEALKTLIQDYFPHIWQDPAAAQRVFASIIGHSPLEGSKAFLRKRALAYVEDGLTKGLRPISDNPIDVVLTKLHEVRKFIAAQDILREAKEIGARKFVYVFEQPPDGWVKVDDPSTAVHAPPFVTVPEAFDEQMRVKTIELLNDLGIPHERLTKLGGKRWGTYETGGSGIRTRFAGPLSVYWHELGHGLQERYGWIDKILPNVNLGGTSVLASELRNLADLRFEGQTPSKSFQKYVRTKDEKAAVMLEAYVHAPDRMKAVAPTIYERVRQFIADRPELHPLESIRPSLVIGSSKTQVPVSGLVTLGHYYMPEGAATVLTNYLSPGLQRFGVIRNLRTMSNVLNAAQLGLSAFHAGFTSIDAAVSTWALGLKNISEGKILTGAKRILTSPLAPVANYYVGKAVQKSMLDPKWTGELKILGVRHQLSPTGQARIEEIGKLAVQAGLRATVDPFWKTQITRNMIRAWNEGGVRGYAGTALRLPFAISEQLMRPILEFLVPRQKLGVFAGMARNAMDRLGPNADINAVRDAMARAADATEDRMGQMTYDNLFYNRIVKDAALMGFRAYGWTYGKYRSLLGGVSDTLRTPARIAKGEPLLTDRMAYLIALPMMTAAIGSTINYLLTGEPPQDWRDAFMPRTGKFDANGNAQRISPPTYVKDFLSDWHDAPNLKKMLGSFYHKLNPWISVGVDIVRNADFYNTRIYNENDPALKQMADGVLHVLKSAAPFSVTGAVKLSESNPQPTDYVLPFFGFVPAKAALTMTPAQNRAAELYRDTLPSGARSPEQADHSQLLRQLVRDMREFDPDNLLNGQNLTNLQPGDLKRVLSGVKVTPFQYQVTKLPLRDAMKVWDLSNDSEREQLRLILMKKFNTSKTVPLDEKMTYWRAFSDNAR